MKIAIVGSRNLVVENMGEYLPENTDEIISGGAKGVDKCAQKLAMDLGIPFTEIKPDYARYKRGAPIVRNKQIVAEADFVLIFWDGVSKGTKSVIDECKKHSKRMKIVYV